MTVQELINKYCNGKDDIVLFEAIMASVLSTFPIENYDFKYNIDEDLEEFDLDEVIDAFVEKADYKLIFYEKEKDYRILREIDYYENDDFYGAPLIHGLLEWPDPSGGTNGDVERLLKPYIDASDWIHDGSMYFVDEETKESYYFRWNYASDYGEGLDVNDFVDYLRDVLDLDVYNDDTDICYGSKTIITMNKNIYDKETADEYIAKIKKYIEEHPDKP